FPPPVGAPVNAIIGAGKRVFVATQGEGFWRYDETLSGGSEVRYQFAGQWLGSATGVVSDIYFARYASQAWIGVRDGGGRVYGGSSIDTLCSNQGVTPLPSA